MIDAARWILSEAWVANGLRIRFASYEKPPSELFGDKDRYWYQGDGEWLFPQRSTGYRPYGDTEVPAMSTDDMRHELAHWLIASPEERMQVNFGATGNNDVESRALAAERVIDSIVAASARIANLALAVRL